ncbi:MAG: hypothetical protein KDB60_02795 [Propionibacteriaceae bacterium]|nr:hypothetical protein [Propionibacteriaceae bacterium]
MSPSDPASDRAEGSPAGPDAPERVARGLSFSLGGIVVGVALTALFWKLDLIASITNFAMAYVCARLYVRGAGTTPRSGLVGLIAVIVGGVVLSVAALIAMDALAQLGTDHPYATLADKAAFVTGSLLSPEGWQSYTGNLLMGILFASAGTFGVIRPLGLAKGA